MKIEIKNRWTGSVIFEGEFGSLKLAVEHCVSAKISLNNASLDRASLDGASLNNASLDRASLDRASLDGALLDRASLDRASLDGASLNNASLDRASLDRASLNGASLNGALLNGASLDGASLNGASLNGALLNGASLNGASLNGASLDGALLDGASLNGALLNGAPFAVQHLDAKILAQTEHGGTLDMKEWHKCQTTHCRGGWAIIEAGEAGKTLEYMVGTQTAAGLIYAASRPKMAVPNFFVTNDEAMADIMACAEKDPLP